MARPPSPGRPASQPCPRGRVQQRRQPVNAPLLGFSVSQRLQVRALRRLAQAMLPPDRVNQSLHRQSPLHIPVTWSSPASCASIPSPKGRPTPLTSTRASTEPSVIPGGEGSPRGASSAADTPPSRPNTQVSHRVISAPSWSFVSALSRQSADTFSNHTWEDEACSRHSQLERGRLNDPPDITNIHALGRLLPMQHHHL